MEKALVIINEQHTLLPEQEEILAANFGGFVRENIPAAGLTLPEICKLVERLRQENELPIVIVSPIPALLVLLARESKDYYVFHNDNRDKKELPGGKIIFTVTKTGWVLV
jgi:hypothetical protein